MTRDLITTSGRNIADQNAVPAIVIQAGAGAVYAYEEFFARDNVNTDRTYRLAIMRFVKWAEQLGLELALIRPGEISDYIKRLVNLKTGKPLSDKSRKLHLTAIRQFFDCLVIRHAVPINPAASVKGPKDVAVEGKTPAVPANKVKLVLLACDVDSTIGLRDRAVVGILAYTGARAGAVAKLRLQDFYSDGTQHLLNLREKGSKARVIPVRHDLQHYVADYINAAGIGGEAKDSPLFRTADGRSGVLTVRPMRGKTVYEMVRRRFKDAGLPDVLTTHSFRAAVVTDLLGQGVPLEDVQQLAGHADPRTTRLYDRTDRQVTRNIVERISF